MKKVIAIGEALIDFIPNRRGCALKDVEGFERVAGGAPANVCAAVSKLGGASSFISQLGKDAFGDHIIEVLEAVGVDTAYVQRTEKANTGLAFVSLKEDGNRDFSFYRNPSADMLLAPEAIQEAWFENCHSLHFCSVDLVESPMKYAHLEAIRYATEAGSIISFDPNVRLPLWDSEAACRDAILAFMPYAHVVKISDEELAFITGYDTIEAALPELFKGQVEMVIYTEGGKGARVYTKGASAQVAGRSIQVADTTGAGDSFIGSFLYQLLADNVCADQLQHLEAVQLEKYLAFANDYAAYSAEGKGAIQSYATQQALAQRVEEWARHNA